METRSRKPYPTDVTDDEWAFLAPYLTLMDPDAPQRRHDLRRTEIRERSSAKIMPVLFVRQSSRTRQARIIHAAISRCCNIRCANGLRPSYRKLRGEHRLGLRPRVVPVFDFLLHSAFFVISQA